MQSIGTLLLVYCDTNDFCSFTQGEEEYKPDKALIVYLKIFYFEVDESDLGDKTKTQTLLMD